MRFISTLAVVLLLVGLLGACKKNDPEPAPAFTFETVSGFVISDEGQKLVATNAGLCSLDVDKGIYVALENQLKDEALKDLVYSFTMPDKELWLASDKGAYNYTGDNLVTESNSGLQNSLVSQIGFNPANIAFFASPEGLSLLDGEAWSLYPGMNDFFLSNEISDIGSTSNGYTYVCTKGGGIERFKADVDGISSATIMDADWTQLESNNIASVYIDDTTQVYATDMGVGFHFSEYTKWDWEVYTINDGLVNNEVLSVVRDHSGLWWIGTAEGISTFHENSWVNYTADQYDMTGNRVLYLAVDIDGSVWMAADQGLSRFSDGQWVAYPKASD